MIDYEQLGLFYLGRAAGQADPLLLQCRHLTTHAVVLGMTGSGKTVLSIGLLKEAALDGIPMRAIDPKGDLGNLALTFPELRGEDFQGWVDPEDARRKQVSVEALAQSTAEVWRAGLESWGQDPARIARLKAAAEVRIYTPGSRSGVPLAMLRSFVAPPMDADEDSVRERIVSTAGGLLSLLGIDADPLQSREHVLVLSRTASSDRGRGGQTDPVIEPASTTPIEGLRLTRSRDRQGEIGSDAGEPAGAAKLIAGPSPASSPACRLTGTPATSRAAGARRASNAGSPRGGLKAQGGRFKFTGG